MPEHAKISRLSCLHFCCLWMMKEELHLHTGEIGSALSGVAAQDALTVLATAIGKIGLTVGVVCFVVLFVR